MQDAIRLLDDLQGCLQSMCGEDWDRREAKIARLRADFVELQRENERLRMHLRGCIFPEDGGSLTFPPASLARHNRYVRAGLDGTPYVSE